MQSILWQVSLRGLGVKGFISWYSQGNRVNPILGASLWRGGGGGVPFCSEINTNCVGSIIDLLSKGPDDNAIGKLFNIRVGLGTRTYSDQFGYIC